MAKTWKAVTQTTQKPAESASAGPAVAKKGKKKREFLPVDPADLTEENGITAGILQGINDGHLQAFWTTLDVTTKAKKAAKAGQEKFIGIRALDGEGCLIGSNNKLELAERNAEVLESLSPADRAAARAPGMCDIWNYGMDLYRRRIFRKALMRKVEGPERAVKTVVVGMLAMDEFTHEEIRQRVLNMKKFKGEPGIEKIVNQVLQANS